jgi:hypothetical protein
MMQGYGKDRRGSPGRGLCIELVAAWTEQHVCCSSVGGMGTRNVTLWELGDETGLR